MMHSGILWYDDDARRTLDEKIAEAAQRYRERLGYEPTACEVNATQAAAPQMVKTASGRRSRASRPVAPLHALRLIPTDHLRPNYFFVGVGQGEPLVRAAGWRDEGEDDYEGTATRRPRAEANRRAGSVATRAASRAVSRAVSAPHAVPAATPSTTRKAAKTAMPSAPSLEALPQKATSDNAPKVRKTAKTAKTAMSPASSEVVPPQVTASDAASKMRKTARSASTLSVTPNAASPAPSRRSPTRAADAPAAVSVAAGPASATKTRKSAKTATPDTLAPTPTAPSAAKKPTPKQRSTGAAKVSAPVAPETPPAHAKIPNRVRKPAKMVTPATDTLAPPARERRPVAGQDAPSGSEKAAKAATTKPAKSAKAAKIGMAKPLAVVPAHREAVSAAPARRTRASVKAAQPLVAAQSNLWGEPDAAPPAPNRKRKSA